MSWTPQAVLANVSFRTAIEAAPAAFVLPSDARKGLCGPQSATRATSVPRRRKVPCSVLIGRPGHGRSLVGLTWEAQTGTNKEVD